MQKLETEMLVELWNDCLNKKDILATIIETEYEKDTIESRALYWMHREEYADIGLMMDAIATRLRQIEGNTLDY